MKRLVIQTSQFEKDVKKIFTNEDLKDLSTYLQANPNAGDVITGTGGVRKLRWVNPKNNKGKSDGGSRMRKKKEEKSLGQKLIETIEEAIENPKSLKVVSRELDIKHLRKMLGLSQSQFAKTYGFNLDTLKKWEQGAHSPDQAVVSYISCIFKKPKLIANIMKSHPDEDSLACSA